MPFPLLRNMAWAASGREKTGGEGGLAAGGRTARLRGEGQGVARGWSNSMEVRLCRSDELLQLIVFMIVIDSGYSSPHAVLP
jgi:hypothetical protein